MTAEYIAASNQGKDVHEETAGMVAFTTSVYALSITVSGEYMTGIPKDDPFYEKRILGLQRLRFHTSNAFVNIQQTLSWPRLYSQRGRGIVLRMMASNLHVFKGAFSSADAARLRKTLQTQSATFTDAEEIRLVNQMLGELGA